MASFMSVKDGAAALLLGCVSLLAASHPVTAQEAAPAEIDPFNPLGHFIYPAEDQDEQLRQKDKEACYAWASEEAQFDPFAVYEQAREAQMQADAAGERQGEVAAGAAKGALRGLLIASITDSDKSQGAARGAAAGGLVSGIKRRRRGKAADDAAAEQQAQAEAMVQRWDGGYVACLEGRKYTVG